MSVLCAFIHGQSVVMIYDQTWSLPLIPVMTPSRLQCSEISDRRQYIKIDVLLQPFICPQYCRLTSRVVGIITAPCPRRLFELEPAPIVISEASGALTGLQGYSFSPKSIILGRLPSEWHAFVKTRHAFSSWSDWNCNKFLEVYCGCPAAASSKQLA